MCFIALGWYFSFWMNMTLRGFNFLFPIHFLVEFTVSFKSEKYKLHFQKEIRMKFLAYRLTFLPCRLWLLALEWGTLYTVSVIDLMLWICKKTVMWVNLKLSSFYCLVRQKIIFNSVPCVFHMCSAFSAAPSIFHLHPTWGPGSPPLANGKHTWKIMITVSAAFQSIFFFTDAYVQAYLFQLNLDFIVWLSSWTYH